MLMVHAWLLVCGQNELAGSHDAGLELCPVSKIILQNVSRRNMGGVHPTPGEKGIVSFLGDKRVYQTEACRERPSDSSTFWSS